MERWAGARAWGARRQGGPAASGRCRMWSCGPGRSAAGAPRSPGLFRCGRFWGTQSFSSAGFLLQNPPTPSQFPQEEYNVPFKPDLQPSPLPAGSRFSARAGFPYRPPLLPQNQHLQAILCAPRGLLPASVPRGRGMQQGRARPTQLSLSRWAVPTTQGTGGRAGERSASDTSVSDTVSAHASRTLAKPHAPAEALARITLRNPHAGSWGGYRFLQMGKPRCREVR